MSYQRKREDKRRMKRLYDNVMSRKRWICSGVCHWDDRYYRVYRGRRSKFYKRHCNKRIRQYADVGNYGYYKKCTEFWWEIW